MIAMETIEKLSKEKLPMITVLAGEDLGQYSQAKEKFLKQIGFDPGDLTYSYFDMSETDYQDAELDLESMPFFADEKVVIFDHFADMTTAKKSYLDEKELKRLENYLESPVETTRLVLMSAGKLDGKRRLVKLLKRDAMVLEASPLKDAELRTYFQKQAHQEGLTFDTGVFEELLIKSNFDFSDVQKNLAFLKGYKTEGIISSQDIAEAIPKSLQDNIFDMTQLLLRGQIQSVRELVHDLRLQGEDEIKLIVSKKGFVEEEFVAYITDEAQVSFPWSMIDKITPRPADSVCQELEKAGIEEMIVTVPFTRNCDYHLSSVQL